MKEYLLTLALMAATAFGALSLRADDTNAGAPPMPCRGSRGRQPRRPRRPTNAPSVGTTP